MKKKFFYLLILLLLLPTSVLGYLQFMFGRKLPVETLEAHLLHSEVNGMDVRFYGTACFYIGYKGKGILTDPFFSNPNAFKSYLRLRPEADALDAIEDLPWPSVHGILVGHSHYDHCLELEEAMERANKEAVAIGNTSLQRLFPTLEDNANFYNADLYSDFIYLADSSIRIYPVASMHAPHIGKIIFADGDMPSDTRKQPNNWLKWKRGTNYSFVIDFMENDSIARRVFVNGGETSFPSSNDERALLSEKGTDLLIMPYTNASQTEKRMAEAYTIFSPTTVIYCHWNNFFRGHHRPIQYIVKSGLPEGITSLQALYPQMPMYIMLPEQSH